MKEVEFEPIPVSQVTYFVDPGGPIEVESIEEGERVVDTLRWQGFNSAIVQSQHVFGNPLD